MAKKSLAVAASFIQMGIQEGDTVAILGGNCAQWLYVDYACLRIKVLMIRAPRNFLDEKALITLLERYKCRLLIVDEAAATKLVSFIFGVH